MSEPSNEQTAPATEETQQQPPVEQERQENTPAAATEGEATEPAQKSADDSNNNDAVQGEQQAAQSDQQAATSAGNTGEQQQQQEEQQQAASNSDQATGNEQQQQQQQQQQLDPNSFTLSGVDVSVLEGSFGSMCSPLSGVFTANMETSAHVHSILDPVKEKNVALLGLHALTADYLRMKLDLMAKPLGSKPCCENETKLFQNLKSLSEVHTNNARWEEQLMRLEHEHETLMEKEAHLRNRISSAKRDLEMVKVEKMQRKIAREQAEATAAVRASKVSAAGSASPARGASRLPLVMGGSGPGSRSRTPGRAAPRLRH